MSFRVRNDGRVTGAEVPQVYLSLPTSAGEPSQRLVGFQRVTLRPGAATTVRVVLDPASTDRPLSVWDTARHSWRTVTGRFTVLVGASVTDRRLSGSFVVR